MSGSFLTFQFDDIGNYLGLEPTPFQVFSTTTGKLYGTLSFDGVTDVALGSLRGITGATLTTAAGEVLAVDPFAIVSVAEPSTGLLLAAGLLGLYGRRRGRL